MGAGHLTVWFSDEAIEAWAAEPRATRGRQPWYSPLAILTALTLRTVFRLAFRQTEGLIGSIVDLLGLALQVPDHTTLSRRSATLDVTRPTRSIGADGETEPLHLLVDSTGVQLCGPGEWLVEKHGTRAPVVAQAAPGLRPRRRSATAICSTSPSTAAWGGRKRPATRGELWPRQRSGAENR